MKPFLSLIALFLLVSCGNTVNTIADDILDGEYELTGIRGNEFSSEEIIFNFNPIGNIVAGETGCNRFSANYQQDGKELTFTTPISTRKFCEGKMRRERQILSSFEKATKLHREENKFILLSAENRPLITLTKTKSSE